MSDLMQISDELLEECKSIDSKESYRRFLERLEAACDDLGLDAARLGLESLDGTTRARAYLRLSLPDGSPDRSMLLQTLAEDNRWDHLLPAAALCVVRRFGDSREFQSKLLLGVDFFTAPESSRDGRFYTIKFMGFSGDTRFIEVLGEVLERQSHHCGPRTVITALGNLDVFVDEDLYPYHRSITVSSGHESTISIHTDERFGNSSNCVHCKFFPCRVNRYFVRAIEDCKLWNKIDPATLGEIIDYRDWGHHLEAVQRESSERRVAAESEEKFLQASRLMEARCYREAIPYLCAAILEREDLDFPLGWVRLSSCLRACGEEGLAFLVLREAGRWKGVFPQSFAEEYQQLVSFDNAARWRLAGTVEDDKTDPGDYLRAMKLVEFGFPGAGFDYRIAMALRESSTSAYSWYEMAECHKHLGERHLATLFAKCASKKTPDPSLQEKFAKTARGMLSSLEPSEDPGLDVERRVSDRRYIDRIRAMDDPAIREHPSEDERAEWAYWFVVSEELTAEAIAAAVLQRLRPLRSDYLVAMPEEFRSTTFYRLNRLAQDRLCKIEGLYPADVKKIDYFQIVERGLGRTGLPHVAAALGAAFHDLGYADALLGMAAGDVQKRGLPLITRFMTTLNLYRCEPPWARPVEEVLAVAQGALTFVEGWPGGEGGLSEEEKGLIDEIRAWIEAVREGAGLQIA